MLVKEWKPPYSLISTSGLIIFVGSTLVILHSKRQFYLTLLCGIHLDSVVEKVFVIRYILRCLGISVTRNGVDRTKTFAEICTEALINNIFKDLVEESMA